MFILGTVLAVLVPITRLINRNSNEKPNKEDTFEEQFVVSQPEDREKWIAQHIQYKIEALITNLVIFGIS